MIKSLLSCNQECARAQPRDPFSGSREVFMGSLNEPRCSIRLRLTLATLQFRCIFRILGQADAYASPKWSCGSTGQRMGTGRPEGKPHPLKHPVEARRVDWCCD